MKPIDFLEQAIPPNANDELAKSQHISQALQQQALERTRALQTAKTLNLTKIAQLLPGLDLARLKTALQANAQGKMTNTHLISLGQAFQHLLTADPVTITKVAAELKKPVAVPVKTDQTSPTTQSAISEGLGDVLGAGFNVVGGARNLISKAGNKLYSTLTNKTPNQQATQAIVDSYINYYNQLKSATIKKYKNIGLTSQELINVVAKDINNSLLNSLGIDNYMLRLADQAITNNSAQDSTISKSITDFKKLVNGDLYQYIIRDLKKNNPNRMKVVLSRLVKLSNFASIIIQSEKEDSVATTTGAEFVSLKPNVLRYKGKEYNRNPTDLKWYDKQTQKLLPDQNQTWLNNQWNELLSGEGAAKAAPPQ